MYMRFGKIKGKSRRSVMALTYKSRRGVSASFSVRVLRNPIMFGFRSCASLYLLGNIIKMVNRRNESVIIKRRYAFEFDLMHYKRRLYLHFRKFQITTRIELCHEIAYSDFDILQIKRSNLR